MNKEKKTPKKKRKFRPLNLKDKNLFSIVRIKPSSKLFSLLKKCESEIRQENPKLSKRNFFPKLEQAIVRMLMLEERRFYFFELQKKGRLPKKLIGQDFSISLINIHSDDWSPIRNKIKEKEIFIINPKYSTDGSQNSTGEPFTKSYQLNPRFANEEDFELIKKRKYNVKKSNWHKFKPEDKKKWKKFSLDKEVAWEELKNSKKRLKWNFFQYYYQTCRVMSINIGHKPPTTCKTGREFNVFNMMPREVRKAVRYNRKPVVDLDLKSSQPTILYQFIEDEGEKSHYEKLINEGRLYEEMFPYLEGYSDSKYQADSIRDLAKLCFCKLVGGAVRESFHYKDSKNKKGRYLQTTGAGLCSNFFRDRFPVLHQRMKEINDAKRAQLVRELQKIESSIVVEGMKELGVDTASIHDGLLVGEDFAKEAHDFLSEKFTEVVGIKPVITGIKKGSTS
jgi:hypothetical protein